MAKKKSKMKPVQMPKPESNVLIIEVPLNKVALGHLPHLSGAGIHDNRPHRQRTRSASLRAYLKDA